MRNNKTYYSKDKTRCAWYDSSIRIWTLLNLDKEGNQVGDAQYHSEKIFAQRWVKYGDAVYKLYITIYEDPFTKFNPIKKIFVKPEGGIEGWWNGSPVARLQKMRFDKRKGDTFTVLMDCIEAPNFEHTKVVFDFENDEWITTK